jgi:prepilin-type processing-associated H-X9-DG protein
VTAATAVELLAVLPSPRFSGFQNCFCFGSVHAGSFNIAMCDGSVRTIDCPIDPLTYLLLGDPADGVPIDGKKF